MVFLVKKFVEKPDANTAEGYIAQGNYYWNSGMFLFSPKTYLSELQNCSADIHESAAQAYQHSELKNDFSRISNKHFAACRNESIDYAVMEKTTKAAMIPLYAPWNDLGCWSSVAESGNADSNGNVSRGNVMVIDSENCFLSSEEHLVSAIGLKNKIVVSTPDAVLVADKKYSQDVKKIVEQLKSESNSVASEHKKMFRPWGYYHSITVGLGFQVKHLMVKPGAKLSLQMHYHRAEHWVVVSGEAEVTNGERLYRLQANQSTYIEKETQHRLANPGIDELHVIEVQSGSYLGEDDIVRFEDIYERTVEKVVPA